MTKGELIDALKRYPDNAEIRLLRWTPRGYRYYLTNPTLSNNPDIRTDCFDICVGPRVTDDSIEEQK